MQTSIELAAASLLNNAASIFAWREKRPDQEIDCLDNVHGGASKVGKARAISPSKSLDVNSRNPLAATEFGIIDRDEELTIGSHSGGVPVGNSGWHHCKRTLFGR